MANLKFLVCALSLCLAATTFATEAVTPDTQLPTEQPTEAVATPPVSQVAKCPCGKDKNKTKSVIANDTTQDGEEEEIIAPVEVLCCEAEQPTEEVQTLPAPVAA